MKLILERWNRFLTEAAIEDISDMGLYLADNYIILYKYLPILSKIKKSLYRDPDQYDISNDIVGIMRLGLRDKHFTVEEVWAEKGYGPIIYRLAIEQSGHYGVSPSIIRGEVSDAASNVWKNFYDGAGSSFVTYEPLGKEVHEQEHLNQIYFSNDKKVDKEKAIKNHNKIFSKSRDPYEELFTHLLETADSKLGEMVRM